MSDPTAPTDETEQILADVAAATCGSGPETRAAALRVDARMRELETKAKERAKESERLFSLRCRMAGNIASGIKPHHAGDAKEIAIIAIDIVDEIIGEARRRESQ